MSDPWGVRASRSTRNRSAAARGSTILATIEFLVTEKTQEFVELALGRLDDDDRQQIAAVAPTDDVPLGLLTRLWRTVDGLIGASDSAWAERAGAFSIQLRGVQSYGGILRKASPSEFLTQQVSLFNLYYHGGEMLVVEEGPNRAILRLTGMDTSERDGLFCRRQTGGLEKAISIAGGKSAKVRHVRCAIEGDAFCEWDMRWEGTDETQRRQPASR